MLIINFSHPLTVDQKQTIEALTKEPLSQLIEQPVKLDVSHPFQPQVQDLITETGLKPWGMANQTDIVAAPRLKRRRRHPPG